MNPFGGGGGAQAKWERAKSILSLAHVDITLITTQRQMHAYEIVKS